MRPRRVAPLLVAALAAVTGGFGASAARASSTPTQSTATQSGKICVALVVDGRALGSNVSTSCATVSKGATGVDVLRAAGHRLTFRNDGLICAIDGLPRDGCSSVDASHYWAYFHRAPGATSWTYSSDNESTYRPANKSTEGWVYDDGTSRTPQNVPYSQICKTTPKPSPAPTRTHHRPHHPTPAPTPTTAHGSAKAKPTATASQSASSSPHPTHHPATKLKHQARKNDDNSRNRSTETITTTSPNPSTTSAALVGGSSGSSSGGHTLLGLGIGLAVVAVLGGLAAIRFRRSS
jgi:hypothetical protein